MTGRKQWAAPLISLGAAGLGLVHLVAPDVRVDGATLGLAVIAVVPWLGGLFESIELPGGAKFQYRRLEERVEAAEQRAAEAQQTVGEASRQARVALVASGTARVREPGVAEAVGRLGAEFVELRRTMPSGPARTYRQELLFAELVRLVPRLEGFDVAGALGSADPGARLAGYARLYACPEGELLPELVAAAVAEELAFAQFWGFQAVTAVIDVAGADGVQLATVRRLRSGLAGLPPEAADRARMLRVLLRQLEAASGRPAVEEDRAAP
ncbi:hypothetical protein [Streptomyces sp. NPDC089919]|uniref:hypothetical protein n=1 Tax=Streptomyces sp. NPDC089919 TaxID=3155188 RepID=UPI00341D5075